MTNSEKDLGAMSMRELLRMEVETQSRILLDNMLMLEKGALTDKHLETMMRAAHSMKGGARIANLLPAVELAHVMEDFFMAARAGKTTLQPRLVDVLLSDVDLLTELARQGAVQDDLPEELIRRAASAQEQLRIMMQNPKTESAIDTPAIAQNEAFVVPMGDERNVTPPDMPDRETADSPTPPHRTARVSVDSMNRLMALIGELSVKDQVANRICVEATHAHRRIHEIKTTLEGMKQHIVALKAGDRDFMGFDEIVSKIGRVDEFLTRTAGVLVAQDAHTTEILRRMRHEVIANRMQPFGDVALEFRRLVRRLGKRLDKDVALEIRGTEVGVDRDILERMNSPLTHLIQNAVDHGIESPEERVAAGKPAAGQIQLSAQHRGGRLLISLMDDGRGIDPEQIRRSVVAKKMVNTDIAASLKENELIEFLFLSDFSMSRQSSDISGRGFGLDLVRHTIRELRGSVEVSTQMGKWTCFEITLPVTLIVVRCLVVEIAGELFAIPMSRISQVLRAKYDAVQSLENRQYLMLDGHPVGLAVASELLELNGGTRPWDELAVVVLDQAPQRYGLVVENIVGERKLVERSLDSRFGKVADVASASTFDDGSPVLILDVDDLIHSIEQFVDNRSLARIGKGDKDDSAVPGKRVLVVDDSITVREVERGLLSLHGYAVDVAVDGAEGWNALRSGKYELVVTDVDMPRMNGIELVKLIRADARLRDLPVIIVSYKDREADRLSGLDAGADRYLTKGSFQDDTFVNTVSDLIGEASS